jgi:PAS domain S-box-containing protein
MVKLSDSDAALLRSIIAENEAWLIDRILGYARRQGYTRYRSTLPESWRQSVARLSASLVDALQKGPTDLELVPEADYTSDALTRFGIQEADLHRRRGLALGICLGLLKYFRQGYLDLVARKSPGRTCERHFSHTLNRCFDRIEIGLVNAWHAPADNGRVADLQQANRDMTNQNNKQAEAALQEGTIWLTEMFNALEDAVFIATPNGRIVDSNLAAQRIFGYTAAELKDKRTEMLHMDHVHYAAFTMHVRETLAQGKKAAFEYMGRRKNGGVFPAMVHIALLRRADDTPLGIVCVLRDLTVLKEAEAAARQSERLQGALELAGAVCHDLNQPLMAITGYAELILLECPDGAPHAPLLNKMVDQVAKVGAITKKLMRVTRYETKTYLNQQIIDIDKASR